jgi:CDP-diacylglycerol--serine O-phosphatidyltransferase
MNNRFELAAMGIFCAMVFDGLDGRVARLTRTQSAFGAEYDSLSDMVAFGAAPALVIYEWALKDMGKLGWGRLRVLRLRCVAVGSVQHQSRGGR